MGCGGSKIIGAPSPNMFKLEKPPKLDKPRSGVTMKDKQTSFLTLDNKVIETVNFNVTKIKKIYKNQKRPNKGKFTDDIFPPDNSIILGQDKNGNSTDPFTGRTSSDLPDMLKAVNNVVWLRASEIFQGKYSVFEGKIEFDDINQGILGDCYFLSAISAMTEFPQLICQIFKTLTVQEDGCYEIGMRINGQWQIVLVDDFFPCNPDTRKPIFAKPKDCEIWVMLLEKAWAKINKGYLNIIGGWPTEVLSVLTPFQFEYILHSSLNSDTIWKKIKEAEEKEFIMACCSNFDGGADLDRKGLVSGHAFTLISAKEANIKGKDIRLVNLRNPWGYKEWNGNWSDNSPLWTQEAKTIFKKGESLDDGKFWMEFEDYLNYFISTEICMVKTPLCSKGIKIEKQNLDLPNVFELELHRNTSIDISVIKKSYRFNRKIPPNILATTTLIIVRKEGNQLIYVDSTNSSTNNPSLSLNLAPGFYLIYTHVDYENSNFDKPRKYVIYVTANNFFELDYKDKDKSYNLLKHIISSQVKNYGNQEEYVQTMSNNFENTNYGYLYISNKSNQTYSIDAKDNAQNYKLLTNDMKAVITKNSEFLIIGIVLSIYDSRCFNIIYENTLTKEKPMIKDYKGDIQSFTKNLEECIINQDDYDFIYKMFEIDYSKIISKIDPNENMISYLKNKYPEEMEKILLYNNNDGVNKRFKDKHFWKEDFYYLGQWREDSEWVRHGVGKIFWPGGTYYIGSFKNDKMDGLGMLIYKEGYYYKINFKDNQMDGDGIYFDLDGKETKVLFKKGKQVNY